jgi:hypothetical protein
MNADTKKKTDFSLRNNSITSTARLRKEQSTGSHFQDRSYISLDTTAASRYDEQLKRTMYRTIKGKS